MSDQTHVLAACAFLYDTKTRRFVPIYSSSQCLNTKEWVPWPVFGTICKHNERAKCYPQSITGRYEPASGTAYRGSFVPRPVDNFNLRFNYGISPEVFNDLKAGVSKQMRLLWEQSFKGPDQEELIQAVWVSQ